MEQKQSKMNILLDTNILIPLEDTSKILTEDLSKIKQLCSKYRYNLYVHPLQIEDINRDRNSDRRKIVLSRVKQYQEIDNPPKLTDEILSELLWKQKDDNDRIDNNLLFSLFRNAVSILVSEDEDIHKKAKRSNLQERVYRIKQFLAFLERQNQKAKEISVGVENLYLYELDVNNSFFDSLRKTYNGFNKWFNKGCEEHRKCWCIRENSKILAICIYKKEENETIAENCKPIIGKILKLCTFKVATEFRGRKFGERLLYIAFKYSAENNYDWIYLHTRGNEQESLIGLCEEYGFYKYGKYKNDDVLLKSMKSEENSILSPLEYAFKYYPYYKDDSSVKKFIVPIQPKYHNDLFPDICDIAQGLFKSDYSMYSTQSNTIKKAYLCHSKIRQLKEGDILLFYRTKDRKSIQCIGIVEQILFSQDINMILSLVSKRTVFSSEDLKEILRKVTLVILFRYIQIDRTISDKKLKQAGVKGFIQSIRSITDEQYKELLK